MTWIDAMNRFGSDKPDIRFGMELCDVSEIVKDCGFGVFTGALEAGGSVRAICVLGKGDLGRKQVDKLVDFAKGYGAKGLAYIQLKSDGEIKSSFAKFMTDEEMQKLIAALDAKAGDLILFAADQNKVVWDVLGALRLHMAKELDLLDPDRYEFLWVTDFPLLEWSEEDGRFYAMHHPFTAPKPEHMDWFNSNKKEDLERVCANAYDFVLNGTELGGGSIRIHNPKDQERMFEIIGIGHEEAMRKFGFLINAFKYGAPPHGGLAFGLDRVCALFGGSETIRDYIAFPKNNQGKDIMLGAPGIIDSKQLDELMLDIRPAAE